jgi:hypothetical protein
MTLPPLALSEDLVVDKKRKRVRVPLLRELRSVKLLFKKMI